MNKLAGARMKFLCPQCGVEAQKVPSVVKRAIKFGRSIYCSKKCWQHAQAQEPKQYLLDRVVVSSAGCWEWALFRTREGYGRASCGSRDPSAHRLSYEVFVGPIPDGKVIDHLCRNTCCINPSHLEPVQQRTNVLRGVGHPARNAAKTHCKRGHPLSGDNLKTITTQWGIGRNCRICDRDIRTARQRERRQEQRHALRAATA